MYNYMQVTLNQTLILTLTRGAVAGGGGGALFLNPPPHPFFLSFFVSIVKIFMQIELSGINFYFNLSKFFFFYKLIYIFLTQYLIKLDTHRPHNFLKMHTKLHHNFTYGGITTENQLN